jgi:hypothetical protein
MKSWFFWMLWAIFIGYAIGFAPPEQGNTVDLIQRLSSGQWDGINPAIVALFNIMGIWPVIYACLALADGRRQPFPAWPFVVASFAVGAFALLPYLGLRVPNPSFSGDKGKLLRWLDSRWTGRAIAVGAIGLLLYGLTMGNWADFVTQWQTSPFIHVMSLDFCVLCGLVPALLGDDMARRGLQSKWVFWAVSLIPLVGISVYLSLRPPLIDRADVSSAIASPS